MEAKGRHREAGEAQTQGRPMARNRRWPRAKGFSWEGMGSSGTVQGRQWRLRLAMALRWEQRRPRGEQEEAHGGTGEAQSPGGTG